MIAGTFAARVAAVVRSIPPGRVSSYGDVAAVAGQPGAARAVGAALRGLPDGTDVPWWRVLGGRGFITVPRSTLAAGLQRALLEAEGVEFDGAGRADLARFRWPVPVDEEADADEAAEANEERGL